MTTTEISPASAVDAPETAGRRVRADLLVTAGILAALIAARLLPGLI